MIKALVRGAIHAFGNLTPGTAATWLERQMMTPRRVAPLPLGPPAASGATVQFPFDDMQLTLTQWGDGSAVVLLVHGWGSATRSFWRMVDPLVARGARVVAVDLPAHGASDGKRTTMLHCADAVLRVGAEVGPLRAVIAHSFGAPTAAQIGRAHV